jgi:hypothetical protein
MNDEPKPINMFAIEYPDEFGTGKEYKEGDLYGGPRCDREKYEPYIETHIKSLSLKGKKLKDYKNKIERDWEAYLEFRKVLLTTILEFHQKFDGPLKWNAYPEAEIKAFQERWDEVSGGLDQPFKKLHPHFVGFILGTQPR